jgi:hypothetical protein
VTAQQKTAVPEQVSETAAQLANQIVQKGTRGEKFWG